MILIGTDSKGDVSIPVHHTGIFGRTGSGKTTLVKLMIEQAVKEGFRVLIFDSKLTQAEFEGMGATIPFYLQENTDPDVYRSLIEGVRTRGRGNMEKFRGGFIELCEPPDGKKAKDFTEIEARLREKLADTKHIKGFTRSMYSEIYHDHLKLNEMLSKHKFTEDLRRTAVQNTSFIVRMPLRDLPNLNLQGLVVRSVIEELLRVAGKMIVVVDEAPNFVNQKLYNPAKSALQQLDSQGRSAQLFGWYTGQTLTGFDKGNMKNLYYWIMGGQSERNEVKAFLDTQTEPVVSKDEVKRLKTREFVVSTPDWAKLVTVPKVGDDRPPLAEKVDRAIRMNIEARTAEESIALVMPPVREVPAYSPEFKAKDIVDDSIDAVVEAAKVVPRTEIVGSITLQVTRLEGALRPKLAYLILKHGSLRQSEMIAEARAYGWVLSKGPVSEEVNRMVDDGLLTDPDTNHRYKFPTEQFKVEVVA